ncbi:MAG: stage II sporulation protein P [Limnochordia bacterium]
MARFRGEKGGPSLLFILVVLVLVAVVGAKYFGFAPGSRQTRPEAPPTEETPEPEPAYPAVVIYHTHGTENYSPADAHSREETGQIVEVGAAIAKALEAQGIRAIHITELHDYPKYGEAYSNSAQSVQRVLDTGIEVGAVIDIHRDGLPPRPPGFTTARIGERDVAKILFVVGDENNPHTEANLDYAEQLRDLLEEQYPGLARGIKVQHINRNGHLDPHSATIFIGDYRGNTLEEALAAAELLADVIAAQLKAQAQGTMAFW